MYYVSIGLMSIVVNVVIRVLHELAAYLMKMWRGPDVSTESVFAVVVCAVIYKCG
jgi:hypothetical protein